MKASASNPARAHILCVQGCETRHKIGGVLPQPWSRRVPLQAQHTRSREDAPSREVPRALLPSDGRSSCAGGRVPCAAVGRRPSPAAVPAQGAIRRQQEGRQQEQRAGLCPSGCAKPGHVGLGFDLQLPCDGATAEKELTWEKVGTGLGRERGVCCGVPGAEPQLWGPGEEPAHRSHPHPWAPWRKGHRLTRPVWGLQELAAQGALGGTVAPTGSTGARTKSSNNPLLAGHGAKGCQRVERDPAPSGAHGRAIHQASQPPVTMICCGKESLCEPQKKCL